MKLIQMRDWDRQPVGPVDFVLVWCLVLAGVHWLGNDQFRDLQTMSIAIGLGVLVLAGMYAMQNRHRKSGKP